MAEIKVIHDTDVGSSLEVVAGKLEAAASMTTDAELQAAVSANSAADLAAADAAAVMKIDAAIQADNIAEAAAKSAEDAAEVIAARRSVYLRNAQTHQNWSAVFEYDASRNGVKWGNAGVPNTYQRNIIMGGGQGAEQGASGFYDIWSPAPGTTVYGLGKADSVVDADGYIILPAWGSLYYKMPPAASDHQAQGTFHVSTYSKSNYEVTEDMIYLGTVNHDVGSVFHRADGVKCSHGATYPDTPWIDMTPYFAAGVSNYDGGFQTCQFRRKDNYVEARGLCEAAGTGFGGRGEVVLAVLPKGFRPLMRSLLTVSAGASSRRLDVTNTGEIVHVNSSEPHTWVPIEFKVALN